ncbi:GerMN domain-containing protein [Treponema sp. TIM-1]|uniref:GerMN domain-containing protein n=1 Tax=Treponema sp. TIM-1 TaxID=2898417 RepID=UPI0039813A7D
MESRNNRRKSSQKPESSHRQLGVIFWLGFFILIICLFFINRNRIRTTIENTHFLDRLYNQSQNGGEPLPEAALEPEKPDPPSVTAVPSPAEKPTPVNPPAILPGEEPAALTPPEEPGPRSGTSQRERAIYFMQVDGDGRVLRTRVARTLGVSDTPMTDALRTLIAGPSPEERRQGLVSFIPPGTELISVMVRGTTAYINLNEEFQFSTFGVEGYAAQLRQIVWTATEFSTVNDVQILIEGKRVDYLGESILIGSPISRDTLP